jgi:hypothetical protein
LSFFQCLLVNYLLCYQAPKYSNTVYYYCLLFNLTSPFDRMVINSVKRQEAAGRRRNLQNEKLGNLYFTRNIIGMIRFNVRWARHVARIESDESKIFWKIVV